MIDYTLVSCVQTNNVCWVEFHDIPTDKFNRFRVVIGATTKIKQNAFITEVSDDNGKTWKNRLDHYEGGGYKIARSEEEDYHDLTLYLRPPVGENKAVRIGFGVGNMEQVQAALKGYNV